MEDTMDENEPKIRFLTRVGHSISRHKVAITAVSSTVITATVLTKLRLQNHSEMIEFIEAKGLMSEFIESHPIITK